MSFINFALQIFFYAFLLELYLANNQTIAIWVLTMKTFIDLFKSLIGDERIDKLEERMDRLEERMDRLEERMDRFEFLLEEILKEVKKE